MDKTKLHQMVDEIDDPALLEVAEEALYHLLHGSELTEAQRKELDRRLDTYDPTKSVTWDELLAKRGISLK